MKISLIKYLVLILSQICLKKCSEEFNYAIKKCNIKTHIKTLKVSFHACLDLFKNLSRFTMNPITFNFFRLKLKTWSVSTFYKSWLLLFQYHGYIFRTSEYILLIFVIIIMIILINVYCIPLSTLKCWEMAIYSNSTLCEVVIFVC